MKKTDFTLYDTLEIEPSRYVTTTKEEISDAVIANVEDSGKGIYVKVDATHTGYINRNFYKYNVDSVRRALKSWTTPVNRPVLSVSDAHDIQKGEPIGRVISVDFQPVQDLIMSDGPNGKVILTLHITDKNAIERIKDKRYLTVSVGSNPKHVLCSICGENLLDSEEPAYLHGHQRGEKYEDGQLCYWDIFVDRYKEISFVNDPADASEEHAAVVTEVISEDEVTEIEKENDEVIAAFYEENYDSAFSELEEDLQDAKLTTKQRKDLSTKTFCGPGRSFPVPDKAHVIAALRLLGRYKGPGDKDKIHQCVLRKAKKLGMDVSKYKDFVEENNKGVSDMVNDNIDLKEFDKIKDLNDSLTNEITTLKDTIVQKDSEITEKGSKITELSDKLAEYQKAEKVELIDEIIELKIKFNSKDIDDFAKETDETKKAELRKSLVDSFECLSKEALEFLRDSLTNIPEIPKIDAVSDIDDAANDPEGNIVDADKKEDTKNEGEDAIKPVFDV